MAPTPSDYTLSPDIKSQDHTTSGIDEKHSAGSLDPDVELQAPANLSADPHASKVSAWQNLGLLDRFLAVWIILAMAIGIILGNFVPNTGPALQKGQFVGVSIPIGECMNGIELWEICSIEAGRSVNCLLISETAVGLLVMMYPILCKVKYESLHHVFQKREIWIQIGFSVFVNWIVAPLLMV